MVRFDFLYAEQKARKRSAGDKSRAGYNRHTVSSSWISIFFSSKGSPLIPDNDPGSLSPVCLPVRVPQTAGVAVFAIGHSGLRPSGRLFCVGCSGTCFSHSATDLVRCVIRFARSRTKVVIIVGNHSLHHPVIIIIIIATSSCLFAIFEDFGDKRIRALAIAVKCIVKWRPRIRFNYLIDSWSALPLLPLEDSKVRVSMSWGWAFYYSRPSSTFGVRKTSPCNWSASFQLSQKKSFFMRDKKHSASLTILTISFWNF